MIKSLYSKESIRLILLVSVMVSDRSSHELKRALRGRKPRNVCGKGDDFFLSKGFKGKQDQAAFSAKWKVIALEGIVWSLDLPKTFFPGMPILLVKIRQRSTVRVRLID